MVRPLTDNSASKRLSERQAASARAHWPFNTKPLPTLAYYAIAIFSILVAALIRWSLGSSLGDSRWLILFYPAIMLAAALGGIGPGLLATLLSLIIGFFLYDLPPPHLRLLHPAPIFRLLLFILGGAFISIVTGLLHNARRQSAAEAQAARDAQAALHDSEERFRSIFSQAGVGICLASADGRFLAANNRLCDMFGYTQDELLNATFKDATYPDDYPALLARSQQLQTGQIDSFSMEKRSVRKDGSLLWVRLTCSAIRHDANRLIAILEDISDRKQAEDELKKVQERYSALFDRSMDCVYLHDFQGHFIDANPAALKLTGYTKEEIPQLDFATVLEPESAALAMKLIDDVLKDGHMENAAEINLRRKNGHRVIVEVKASLILHDGRPFAVQGIARDVTDRKFVDQALRESEEKFRTLAESAHACFGIVQGQRFIYANPYFEQISGYTHEELLNKDFPDLIDPSCRQVVVDRARRRQRGQPVPTHYEFLMLTKTGEQRWVDFSAAAIEYHGKPAIVGAGYDITERKLAEEALRHSQQRFQTLAAATFEGIVITDEDGRIVDANDQFAHIFGYTPAELIGMDIANVIAPDDRQRVLDDVARGENVDIEHHAVRKDASLITVEMHVRTILYHGRHVRISAVRDITERKRSEAALRESEARLAEAKETAEAASRAKDRFLAILSHELRTPLTPVLAAATILEKDHRLPPDTLEDLEMIRRNVELEARLIDDLLDLTRISRGKLEIKPQHVEACTVLRHTIEICSQDIDAKNLHLGTNLTGNNWLHADPSRLQQIFWNLINNAIKFTPPGGCIGVACTRNEHHAVIEIHDSGVGIEPDVLPRIFDAFEQGSRLVTRRFGGLGLGLSISKALVDLHGGSITAHSEGKGRGATFRVLFPLIQAPRQAAPAEPTASVSTPPPRPSDHKPKILLVEDHYDTARIISQLLRVSGYDVQTADTVAAASHLAMSQEFDLIISDLGLPDGTGLDLMRNLIAAHRPLKGIALTGFGMDEDITRSHEAGFLEHLTKPINFDHLQSTITRVIES